MKRMLTTAEVADRWGRSQKLVQAVIKQGRLKAVLFGKTYLVEEADADSYKHRAPGRPSNNGHTKPVSQKPKPRIRNSKKAKR